MIKYNNSNINDWYFDESNIIKVYRNGAVCYYKITVGGQQVPCYAVVDDISQYSDTEFEDVFNKADGKWYKLNNLNQYEEYGIYGSGRNITYYEGKLTIDDGYEYMYSGSSWVNVGEISGGTKTSGFTSSDIGDRITSMVSDGDYIMISYYNKNSTSDPTMIMSYRNNSPYYVSNLSGNGITSIDSSTVLDAAIWKLEATATADTFYIQNVNNNMYWGYQSRASTRSFNLVDSTNKCPVQFVLPACKDNSFGFVEKKSNSSTVYGGYGLNQLNARTYQLNWWDNGSGLNCGFFGTDGNSDFVLYKIIGTKAIYPLNYDVIQTPPNNLTFSSMTEAEAYECPWVGMSATIDGVKYIFSGDSQSGYEWVYNPSRLPQGYTEVEYIQNTGTSYIDTNFVPNQDSRIVADMQMVTQTSYWPRIWGAGAFSSANGLTIAYQDASGTRCLQVSWFGDTSWTSYSSVVENTNRHIYDLNKNYMYVDEVLVGSHTYTTRTASDHLGIFTYIASGRPGSSSYWGKEHFLGKMYSFQVYDNGTLVRDLVPCIRDNDSTVGAYDVVNDVFYTVPSGYTTDTLVAGNPV